MNIHETQRVISYQEGTPEIPNFNNATNHYQNIIGVPSKRADLNALPKPIRWFSYFVATVMFLGLLTFVVSYFITK